MLRAETCSLARTTSACAQAAIMDWTANSVRFKTSIFYWEVKLVIQSNKMV